MGNRGDLLSGAKRCLLTKGYARTTARDIAEESGVSLAAIGYHFGSKDALLNEAMIDLLDDWAERFAQVGAHVGSQDPVARFGALWTRLLEVAGTNRRLVAATFEAFPPSEQDPALRTQLADAQHDGRRGLVALMYGVPEEEVSDAAARTLGSFYLALMSGVLAQWLIAPDRAPSGADLAEAIRIIAAGEPPP